MILYQIIPFLLSVNPSECVWRFDTKCQSCINVTISKKVTENSCFVGLLWVSNRHDQAYRYRRPRGGARYRGRAALELVDPPFDF